MISNLLKMLSYPLKELSAVLQPHRLKTANLREEKARQCRRKKWKLLRCVKITSNWARH